MERDFTPTEPIIFCQACGAKNSSFDTLCRVCKAPLVFYSFSDKEEKLFDELSEETYIFDELRAIKDTLTELKNGFVNLSEEINKVKRDLTSVFNGLSTLREILEEKEILRGIEVEERWEEKESLTINIEDQVNHFLKKKDGVLSKYKGKNFSNFVELVDKALKLMRNKNIKSCVEILKKALKKDPKNIELLNLLAFISLKNRDFKGARDFLKKSLKIEKNPEALFLTAWLLSSQEKYKSALELVERVKDGFPDSFLINLMEGNLNFTLKDYRKAVNSFNKALNYEDSPYIRYFLFRSFYNLNDKKSCLPHLEKLKNDEFYREMALFNLGKINYFFRKRKVALHFLEELIEEFPQKLKYYFNYLFVKDKFNFKTFGEFREDINQLWEKFGREDFSSVNRISTKLFQKKNEEPLFFLSYLLFHLKKEDIENHLKELEKLLNAKNYEFYEIMAFLIYNEILKNKSRKNQIFNLSLKLYRNSDSHLAKGIYALYLSRNTYEQERDIERAINLAKEALILLPEDLKIYGIENIARLVFEKEKKEEIYEILKEVSLNLKEEGSYLNLAKQALKMGKEKEAKEIFKNMRKYYGKPFGLLFYYWKELFNEIRSYLI